MRNLVGKYVRQTVLIALSLLLVNCVMEEDRVRNDPVLPDPGEKMKTVFGEYWSSAHASQEKIDDFISEPSTEYFRCSILPIEECASAINRKNSKVDSGPELVVGDTKSANLRFLVPNHIRLEEWSSFEIDSVKVLGTVGKLVITVNSGSKKRLREVLLQKKGGRWTLFEIREVIEPESDEDSDAKAPLSLEA